MDLEVRTRKMLWITIPYIHDDQTWCVATARPQDIWRNIFNIYTVVTWLALVGAVFLIAFLVFIAVRLEKRRSKLFWTFLIGLAAAIGQYASYEPKRTSVRVLLIFVFMYGMVMTTSFNSFLISILTRPRFNAQVDSVQDAIDVGMTFAGGDVALAHFNGDDKVRWSKRAPNYALSLH